MPTKEQLESALRNADKAGDVASAKKLANALKAGQFEQAESFTGASVIEPAAAVVSSAVLEPIAGLAGLATGGNADVVRNVQGMAYEPRTQAGQEGMATLGALVQKGVDLANIPISGLAGLAELVAGNGIDKAAETIKAIQTQGTGKTLGDRAFEATGSPLAGALASSIPTAAMSIAGVKGGGNVAAAIPVVSTTVEGAAQAGKGMASQGLQAGKELVRDVSRFKMPSTREAARKLQAGEVDRGLARYTLADEGITEPTARQKLLGADLPKVVSNKPLLDASKQGFDEGFLNSSSKRGSVADKKLMLKMTNIGDKIRKDPFFEQLERPSFVAGDVLLQKVNTIKQINRRAGQDIGKIAQGLKGKTVTVAGGSSSSKGVTTFEPGVVSPVADIGDKFVGALEALNIKVNGDKLDFTDSLVSGTGRRKSIQDVYGRMVRNQNPDALDLHQLKQYIDETVSYGKTVRGLSGKAEGVLKDLRRDIKEKLEASFPEYAAANKTYSETIDILDEIQRLAGKNTDLTSDSADGQLAILARRITSNAQSRGQVLDAVNRIEQTLDSNVGYGRKLLSGEGDGKVNLSILMRYADELDRVTGNAAKTSFTGASETALQAAFGPKEFLKQKAIEKAQGLTGITNENAYKSMREFLKAELQKPQKK